MDLLFQTSFVQPDALLSSINIALLLANYCMTWTPRDYCVL